MSIRERVDSALIHLEPAMTYTMAEQALAAPRDLEAVKRELEAIR